MENSNLDNLTLGQIKEISKLFTENIRASESDHAHPYIIGHKYLIRTVSMTLLGRLSAVYKKELVLKDASWVADTGRFHKALADGTLNEVEPFPDGGVIIGRGAIIDCAQWAHELPRETC